jgi:hypothetical protein
MLRNLIALLVLGLFVAGGPSALSAQADDARQGSTGSLRTMKSPLAPGSAAGIKQAQAQRSRIWNFVPFGVLGGLAALIVLMNDDDGDIVTTTTATN